MVFSLINLAMRAAMISESMEVWKITPAVLHLIPQGLRIEQVSVMGKGKASALVVYHKGHRVHRVSFPPRWNILRGRCEISPCSRPMISSLKDLLDKAHLFIVLDLAALV